MAAPGFTSPTIRKRLYLQQLPNVIAGKISKREAARIAGFSDTTRISRIETPQLKAQFARLMRRYVPMHKIAARIAEGINATETKFFQHEGKVTDRRDIANFAERRQYAKLAAELGCYIDTESVKTDAVQINATTYNFNVEEKKQALESLLEQVTIWQPDK